MNAQLQIAGQVREDPVTGDAPPTGGDRTLYYNSGVSAKTENYGRF